MVCHNCGAQIDPSSQFCGACGARVGTGNMPLPGQTAGKHRSPVKVWLVCIGAFFVLLIAYAILTPSSKTVQSPATAQSTPATQRTDEGSTSIGQVPRSLLKLSGSGTKSTQTVTVPGEWQLAWKYDCSNFGVPQGNFIVSIYNSDGTPSEAGLVNQIGRSGSDTEYYHQGGTVYFVVNSECRWSIHVIG